MFQFLIVQKERLKTLLMPPKRICVRKMKTCSICGKELLGTSSLKRHMKQVHGVNENDDETSLDETQPGCSYKMSDRVPAESFMDWKKTCRADITKSRRFRDIKQKTTIHCCS